MIKKLSLWMLLFSVTFSSCYRKIVDPYFGVYFTKIDSKVLSLERVSIADTTLAYISGTIFSKDNTDTLPPSVANGAVVFMIDQRTGKIYGNLTDNSGKYQIHLPTSIYHLKVQDVGYNTLVVRNVNVQPGDIFVFNAQLGLSIAEQDSSVYELKADKTIELNIQQKSTE